MNIITKLFKNKEEHLKCKDSAQTRDKIDVSNMDDGSFLAIFYDKFGDFFSPVKLIDIHNYNVKLVPLLRGMYKNDSQNIDLLWEIKYAIKHNDTENVLCLTQVLLGKTKSDKSIFVKFAPKIFKMLIQYNNEKTFKVLLNHFIKEKSKENRDEATKFLNSIIKYGDIKQIKSALDSDLTPNLESVKCALKQTTTEVIKLVISKFVKEDQSNINKILNFALETKDEEKIENVKAMFDQKVLIDNVVDSSRLLIALKFSQENLCEKIFNRGNVNIAIGHGEGSVFSDKILELATEMTEKTLNLKFYQVTGAIADIFEQKCGEEIYKYFDGWINPGSDDKYPFGREFSLSEYVNMPKTSSEESYLEFLIKIENYKIPYIGICGGAQSLVLHYGGYLDQVHTESKDGIGNVFSPISGTFAYYLHLSQKQQQELLTKCVFPKVDIKIDRTHDYAAVEEKLGKGIVLGGKTADGVVMSYCHKDGLKCATQFHPENKYTGLTH